MHITSIKREVDRAEYILERPLRKKIYRTAVFVSLYCCICIIIGIIMITHCIEDRHIDLANIASDNLH